ncbi:GntR family transcriptional regulator [Pseudonocardia sp. NPDC046786]|uniref:GntR family transcriptional regulator n=1 Tax=Pseudonocardia sp. NPDC046786 TaxID=3155471 RepID=UPI0033C37DC1
MAGLRDMARLTVTARRAGNTVDEIYRTLRERIIDGVYGPGIRMSQGGIAAELNVSRTPLREALQRLEADGLLVGRANRGMEVAPARVGQVEEYYALRLLIEPPTLAEVARRMGARELATMESELAAMCDMRNRVRDFQEAHLRFHELVIRRYPNTIAELVHSLHTKIYRYQRLHFSRPEASNEYTSVDRLFLEALRERNFSVARRLFEFHLIDAAIGMIHQSEPDYRFDALLVAARGVGIHLDSGVDGSLPRPASLTWANDREVIIPDLMTSNLQVGGSPKVA